MVPRTRALLMLGAVYMLGSRVTLRPVRVPGRWSPAAWWLLFALGCRADSLGVVVPRGGPDSISAEDLQRDTISMMGGPSGRSRGGADARAAASHLAQRFGQMHLVPGYGRAWQVELGEGRALVCGRRDGAGDAAVVVLALDHGAGAVGGAAPMAALVSLAKAWDTPKPPPRPVMLCGLFGGSTAELYGQKPPVPLASTASILQLGDLGGPTLSTALSARIDGVLVRVLSTDTDTVRGSAEDRVEAIDYRLLAAQVREIHGHVIAALAAPER